MRSRTIELTERQAEIVDRLVRSGGFQDESEVIRESLLLLELHQADDELKLAALRAAVQVGIDDMEAGRYRTFETEDQIREHVANLTHRRRRRGGADQ
jgi:antitoxin ParD1/3/4